MRNMEIFEFFFYPIYKACLFVNRDIREYQREEAPRHKRHLKPPVLPVIVLGRR